MELSEKDRKMLQRLEEELWREDTRFDMDRMNDLIADDFFEFGVSGRFYTRDDTLAIPRQPLDAVIPFPDFKVRLLAEDVAQVTYNCTFTFDGIVYHTRRSSIWSRIPGGWVLRFHQGTPIPGNA
jgi:hypothetical protein